MNSDNRVNSQQSLDRRNNHLVEDPGVKELLSTCAKYNLDQGVSGMEGGYPAEILDEIRQAESLRSSSSPHSPVKDKDQECPSSPPPLAPIRGLPEVPLWPRCLLAVGSQG